jgi:hypothetical protein
MVMRYKSREWRGSAKARAAAPKEPRGEKAHRLAVAKLVKAARRILGKTYATLSPCERELYMASRDMRDATAMRAAERRAATKAKR